MGLYWGRPPSSLHHLKRLLLVVLLTSEEVKQEHSRPLHLYLQVTQGLQGLKVPVVEMPREIGRRQQQGEPGAAEG